ncbi:MAG: hypothetical protein QG626_56 [Patescibacteria group bacterium]|jgi:signal transduction histidine kinase|nr:hypothetical protein [Patescibacteria group bacterium]
MPHPHEYLLQEFKISIDKLVPLTPLEVVEEAKKLYEELSASEVVTERQIRQALILIGKKEFPYRKAYLELCAQDEEQRLQAEVVKRLEGAVAEKVQKMVESGVHVMDYVNSKLFERDLEATERYQVEQAILAAHDVLNKQCDDRAKERQQNFDELVARWKQEEDRLQQLIDQLRGMAERDMSYADEIKGKADQFEEGWSIVERDPLEDEIKQEIAHWTTVLEEADEQG